ncbi:CHASE domain-containing protein [Sediminibacterium salmoneum]|uniref:CHASE domain-containing protein n=1 Tax=Sediminibacterium salmoneum TaxID=426421 RepID=UPI00047DD95B|nr:CHASE domain-containing protein [Sediminibacterium salmoneum]
MKEIVKHSRFTSWLVFVLMIVVTQILAWKWYEKERSLEKQLVEREVIHIGNQIETTIQNSSSITSVIASMVEHNLLNNHFDMIAEKLLSQNEYIDAIQLVQDMVITHTYPLKGNEQVIGFNLKTYPEHIRESMLSSSSNKLHFEGPLKLKQGGVGFVGRYPILQQDTLWGFAAVIIRKKNFIKSLGLNDTGISELFYYQLSKQQEGERYTTLFAENRTDFATGVKAVAYNTVGDWIIQVKLKKPRADKMGWSFSLIGLLVSFIVLYTMLLNLKRK